MKAFVALSGDVEDSPLLRERIAGVDLIIAADGGAARLRTLGLTPNIVIGDLDSLERSEVERLRTAGVEIVAHPQPQQRTDGEVALRLAQARGAKSVIVVGASGGPRLDHSLANLLYTAARALRALQIRIVAGESEAVVLRGDGQWRVRFQGRKGDIVSLIPVSARVTGVETHGLRYPLRRARLTLGASTAVSNALSGCQGGFTIESGVAFAVHTRARASGQGMQ